MGLDRWAGSGIGWEVAGWRGLGSGGVGGSGGSGATTKEDDVFTFEGEQEPPRVSFLPALPASL